MEAPGTAGPAFGAYDIPSSEGAPGDATFGELGSGFNGHYGKDVNAIGLDCAIRTLS